MRFHCVTAAIALALASLMKPCAGGAAAPAVIGIMGDLASVGSLLFTMGDSSDDVAASSTALADDKINKADWSDIDADVDDSLREIKNDADEGDPPTHDEKIIEQKLPAGVPKYVYRMCKRDLKGHRVHVISHSTKSCTFRNVPPTCMTLANVFIGDGQHGPRPTPCGSACLAYHGMTKKQHRKLVRTLKSHAHHRGHRSAEKDEL